MKCQNCNGSGEVLYNGMNDDEPLTYVDVCSYCGGSGEVEGDEE